MTAPARDDRAARIVGGSMAAAALALVVAFVGLPQRAERVLLALAATAVVVAAAAMVALLVQRARRAPVGQEEPASAAPER